MNNQDNAVPGPQAFTVPQPQAFAIPEPQGFAVAEPQGFTIEDILWATGIWSIILCLSPMIVFYVLMVA